MDTSFVAKKKFGQHFLHDKSIINKIVAHSCLNENDKIIAEGLTKVRPGMKVKLIIKSQ